MKRDVNSEKSTVAGQRKERKNRVTVVIDYETFCKIRLCHRERCLNFTQIAREFGIHRQQVAFHPRLVSIGKRKKPSC